MRRGCVRAGPPGALGSAPPQLNRRLESASKPILFHGYYFRIMANSDGQFAAIAYPAMYCSSGVMTFIATQGGGVSEKDLGPNTANIAGAMHTYRADATWTPAESKP